MRLLFVFLFLFISNYNLKAQYQIEVGARQGAMGGSGLVLTDLWSSYHNQAGMSDLKNFSAGVFYSSLFNIPELRESAFAIVFPTEKFGSAGLNYTYSGNPASNFSKFGLAYSKRLTDKISAGIQLDYFYHTQIQYGNSGAAVGEIGIITEPKENLYIGVHVFNPWRAKFSEFEETLMSTIRMGIGYKFQNKLLLTTELEKELDKEAGYKAGAEYILIEDLFLRLGVSSNPIKYSFGIGYDLRGIKIDVSYISHEIIGYYMQFGLCYRVNRRQ